jgi:hypothetical protein
MAYSPTRGFRGVNHLIDLLLLLKVGNGVEILSVEVCFGLFWDRKIRLLLFMLFALIGESSS